MNKKELVDEAIKLNEELDKLRGYDSGLRRKMIESLDEKTLKDCNEKTKKQIERLRKER